VFTGLVEAVGTVRGLTPQGSGADLEIETDVAPALALGESVAVSGVCLSVARLSDASFVANAIEETIRRTTLRTLAPGARVNIERSVRAGDRLGGHLVTGHVDGVARVVSRASKPYGESVEVEVPPDLVRYLAPKGSVALDGVSLTIGEVRGRRLTVYLIPYTLSVTIAGAYEPGTLVNVEVDLVSRYVERLLAVPAAPSLEEES